MASDFAFFLEFDETVLSALEDLPDCEFEVRERTPCDPLWRLVSTEESADGTITMVLEAVDDA